MMAMRRYLIAEYDWTGLGRLFYKSKVWELTALGLVSAFVIALSGAMAPGPLLALVIAQVLAQGGGAVLWILAGHAAANTNWADK
jgi:hypothetical protein